MDLARISIRAAGAAGSAGRASGIKVLGMKQRWAILRGQVRPFFGVFGVSLVSLGCGVVEIATRHRK